MTTTLRPGRMIHEKTCEVCSAVFSTNHADQRFCGKSCAAKRHWQTHEHPGIDQSKANSPEARAKKSAKLSGQGNPMHGRTGQANPAFTTGEYAGVRAYRAKKGTACTDCSATADLLVHHEDRDRSNNADENLVTLCRGCHTRRHLAAGDITAPNASNRQRDAGGRFL